ncbi:MAG TPA: secretin N-terminal domain-containing protein [Candidatus Limnocylindria bacterium]|nr:secretin N-terminal domain-containing protein [Candidatus Limnocylindria bacterium]
MRPSRYTDKSSALRSCLILAQVLSSAPLAALAEDAAPPAGQKDAASATNSVAGGTNTVATPGEPAKPETKPVDEPIQISFQGANIDMIVQWLAEKTGKSVIKHPQAQCQLNIVSSKKLSLREAIALIYRALSLEGFSAIESATSILIVPEGKEPKMSPEFIDASRTDIPVGRQKLMKIFQLQFSQANDIKEKIKGVLTDKSAIDINERANQIIITDYNDNIALVGDIIKALDTDRPGDVSVRVLALKNVSASDLVKEIAPLYQKTAGKSGADIVEVSANDRSNSLIILSSESSFRAIERMVKALDTEDAQEKVMQTFLLHNADAEDVAKQLKDLMADSDSTSRYRYYYFDSGPTKPAKKSKVVADRRRNTVVVQAAPSEMLGIGKMIAALDEPAEGGALAPKIYPLKYVSALDMEDVLNELFLKKTQQRPYYYFYDDYQDTSTPDRDVGRLYGKIRITSEPYQNALIITANSKESLAAVEEVLNKLDAPSQAGESTFRVSLKFAKAPVVANSLNILFAKGGSPPLRPVNQPQPQNNNQQNNNFQNQNSAPQNSFELDQESKEDGYFPWLGGQPDNPRNSDGKNTARQVSDLVGRVRVVSDQRSNSLLVSANMHSFAQVMKLIDELDAPTAQVLIEARIVEVSSNFMDRLGVRWSPDGSKTFTDADRDGGFLVHAGGQYTKGFGGKTEVNSPANNSAIGSALTSLRSGVLDNTVSMDFLIQFLRQNVGATVLAEPQINVEDNEIGKLFVGSQVPFIDKSQSTDVGSLNQSFSYKNVGIILEVSPHINKSGDVSLRIRAESSTIEPGQQLFGGAIVDTRNFKTDVTAHDGETLVLGGIIQKQISDNTRKVPILGSIPGLGWAFKKKDKSIQEVELLVFLRPRVVRTVEEARNLAEGIEQSAPLIRKWKAQKEIEDAKDKDDEKKKAEKSSK